MIVEIDDHELLPRVLWRELVKRRADHCCERCGRKPVGKQRLNAHHQDWDPSNHTLANGRALCVPCHRYVHWGETTPATRTVDAESITRRNRGVRPHGTSAGMLAHVRGKIRSGKKLRRNEYRKALAAMLYVPAELRPE